MHARIESQIASLSQSIHLQQSLQHLHHITTIDILHARPLCWTRCAQTAHKQMSQIVLLTPEEQAAKRAAQLKRLAALPEHLRLGVTLPGMRELLKQMPLGAVEQVNAKIPREESKRFGVFTWKGKPKFPKNETFNGYCYQYWFTKWAEEAKEGQPKGDGLAVCERLRQ